MLASFTVITRVRQRFGDTSSADISTSEHTDWNAPLVGEYKEYYFDCPKVNSDQESILQFQIKGVTGAFWFDLDHEMKINNIDIPGALRNHSQFWSGKVFIVPPNILKDSDNALFIKTTKPKYGPNALDDFIIDNIVIHYKLDTRQIGTLVNY